MSDRVPESQPELRGRWTTLPAGMAINPVHVALMYNGKVLVIAGSGNNRANQRFHAGVWNPVDYGIRTFSVTWDMFCSGMVILPDGRPFVFGGTLAYPVLNAMGQVTLGFLGQRRASIFDVSSERFVDAQSMTAGRWYPTGTVLGDGSVLVVSGFNDSNSSINTTVEIWRAGQWNTARGRLFAGAEVYPRQHLLRNGKVFESGWNTNSQMYNPETQTWTEVAHANFGTRVYGTSVLLPLTRANNWQPSVMILGGAQPNTLNNISELQAATNTTELINLSDSQPMWLNGPMMDSPRVQLNATILPNGQVLVSGGSPTNEHLQNASLTTQLYDPGANSFSSGSLMEFPRLYHSNTLLLPDATVMATGSNPDGRPFESTVEIYSPPYLFNSGGSAATRPTITAIAPAIHYGAAFQITTPNAANISKVVLIRPGAVTHSFDMEQRLVELVFTINSGQLSAIAPDNGNIAPPGYYMVFILNSTGVPSVASFVRLS